MVEAPDDSNAAVEHIGPLDRPTVPRSNFDRAMLAYLQLTALDGRNGLSDGRRRRMVTALNNRASWETIRHWRRGTRPAPQWAVELLDSKIAARQAIDNGARLALAQ